jgi:hypothetical protein
MIDLLDEVLLFLWCDQGIGAAQARKDGVGEESELCDRHRGSAWWLPGRGKATGLPVGRTQFGGLSMTRVEPTQTAKLFNERAQPSVPQPSTASLGARGLLIF